MLHSMTGYGKGKCIADGIEIVVEIKSVNSRYCDVYIKMPRLLFPLEDRVRSLISKRISRGKLDLFVSYSDFSDDSKTVLIDQPLTNAYKSALQEIRDKYLLRDDISASVIARFPDVLTVENKEVDLEKVWNLFNSALNESLDNLIAMRNREGEALKSDLIARGQRISELLDIIKDRAPNVVLEYRERLKNRIKELLENKSYLDETRLEQEVAFFADKCAIDEEITRLDSHVAQLREILELDEPIGRKLDFLVQEMNRETNTIGSKANDIKITRTVLEIKSEIEKIREQVQNIE